jgi:hypothetical protein
MTGGGKWFPELHGKTAQKVIHLLGEFDTGVQPTRYELG